MKPAAGLLALVVVAIVAGVIEDGCSDDCFRDFRAYLISLGREPYEAALRDPDSLAPVVEDAASHGTTRTRTRWCSAIRSSRRGSGDKLPIVRLAA